MSKYCDNCINWNDEEGCPITLVHEIYNYKEGDKKDSILHLLIPRDKNGNNLKCSMFKSVDDYIIKDK